MKKILACVLSVLFLLLLVACGSDSVTDPTTDIVESNDYNLLGTWTCDAYGEDIYFIFEENGDCFAKMGSCTIYGVFDNTYDNANEKRYSIELGNFFLDEYTAKLSDNNKELTLTGNEYYYILSKATLPEIKFPPNDNFIVADEILGDWLSESSIECYRFNADGTAVITDLYNDATLDCTYTCDGNTATLTYMSTATTTSSREVVFEAVDNDHIILNNIAYERAEEN